MTFIVAVDGPSASGKGTIVKSVAREMDFDYLNTGLLYRGLAFLLIKHNKNVNDYEAIQQLIQFLDLGIFNQSDLYTQTISNMSSVVAADPFIRKELLEMQRKFPLGKKKVIVEGRDIGTVIFPQANLKIFITASLDERVRRRFKQLQLQGEHIIKEDVLRNDMQERDARDSKRSCAPMVLASDYKLVDTTGISVEKTMESVLQLVREALE